MRALTDCFSGTRMERIIKRIIERGKELERIGRKENYERTLNLAFKSVLFLFAGVYKQAITQMEANPWDCTKFLGEDWLFKKKKKFAAKAAAEQRIQREQVSYYGIVDLLPCIRPKRLWWMRFGEGALRRKREKGTDVSTQRWICSSVECHQDGEYCFSKRTVAARP